MRRRPAAPERLNDDARFESRGRRRAHLSPAAIAAFATSIVAIAGCQASPSTQAPSSPPPPSCPDVVECLVAPLNSGDETRVAVLHSVREEDAWVYFAPGGPGLSNVDELSRHAEVLSSLFPDLTFWTFDDANTGDRFDPACDALVLDWLSDPDAPEDERMESCLATAPPTAESEFATVFETVVSVVDGAPSTTSLLGVSSGADVVLAIAARHAAIVSRAVIDAPAMTAGRVYDDIRYQASVIPDAVAGRVQICVDRGDCSQLRSRWPEFPLDFIHEGGSYHRAVATRLASLSDQTAEQLLYLVDSTPVDELDEVIGQFVQGGWSYMSTHAMVSVSCTLDSPRPESSPPDVPSPNILIEDALGRVMQACPARLDRRAALAAPVDHTTVPLLALLNDSDPVSDPDHWAGVLAGEQNVDVVHLDHYGHSSFALDPCGVIVVTAFIRDEYAVGSEQCTDAAIAAVWDGSTSG